MREILFRGFHECENGGTVITVNGVEKHGKWVEATSLICNFGSLENKVNNVWEHSYLIERGSQIGVTSGTNGKQNLICTTFEVIPETVCQFTGLADKNGVRIFENDIISDGVVNYIIEFYNSAWFKRFVRTQDSHSRLHYNANYLEVIGNIFKNADLMEEEKQC